MRKHLFPVALILAAALLSAPVTSAAPSPRRQPGLERNGDQSVWMRNRHIPDGDRTEGARANRDGRGRSRAFGAPEIDPGLLSGGLALLLGGTLVLLGQRRATRSES